MKRTAVRTLSFNNLDVAAQVRLRRLIPLPPPFLSSSLLPLPYSLFGLTAPRALRLRLIALLRWAQADEDPLRRPDADQRQRQAAAGDRAGAYSALPAGAGERGGAAETSPLARSATLTYSRA